MINTHKQLVKYRNLYLKIINIFLQIGKNALFIQYGIFYFHLFGDAPTFSCITRDQSFTYLFI